MVFALAVAGGQMNNKVKKIVPLDPLYAQKVTILADCLTLTIGVWINKYVQTVHEAFEN